MPFTAAGVPTVGSPLRAQMLVPNDPTLFGQRFVWQAIAIGDVDGLRCSNPSIYVP